MPPRTRSVVRAGGALASLQGTTSTSEGGETTMPQIPADKRKTKSGKRGTAAISEAETAEDAPHSAQVHTPSETHQSITMGSDEHRQMVMEPLGEGEVVRIEGVRKKKRGVRKVAIRVEHGVEEGALGDEFEGAVEEKDGRVKPIVAGAMTCEGIAAGLQEGDPEHEVGKGGEHAQSSIVPGGGGDETHAIQPQIEAKTKSGRRKKKSKKANKGGDASSGRGEGEEEVEHAEVVATIQEIVVEEGHIEAVVTKADGMSGEPAGAVEDEAGGAMEGEQVGGGESIGAVGGEEGGAGETIGREEGEEGGVGETIGREGG